MELLTSSWQASVVATDKAKVLVRFRETSAALQKRLERSRLKVFVFVVVVVVVPVVPVVVFARDRVVTVFNSTIF